MTPARRPFGLGLAARFSPHLQGGRTHYFFPHTRPCPPSREAALHGKLDSFSSSGSYHTRTQYIQLGHEEATVGFMDYTSSTSMMKSRMRLDIIRGRSRSRRGTKLHWRLGWFSDVEIWAMRECKSLQPAISTQYPLRSTVQAATHFPGACCASKVGPAGSMEMEAWMGGHGGDPPAHVRNSRSAMGAASPRRPGDGCPGHRTQEYLRLVPRDVPSCWTWPWLASPCHSTFLRWSPLLLYLFCPHIFLLLVSLPFSSSLWGNLSLASNPARQPGVCPSPSRLLTWIPELRDFSHPSHTLARLFPFGPTLRLPLLTLSPSHVLYPVYHPPSPSVTPPALAAPPNFFDSSPKGYRFPVFTLPPPRSLRSN